MQDDLPLAGVVAVELSDNASLPYGGQLLAGLGAEVWKVERPGGDATRTWGPSRWRGEGVAFHALNRGKRSICLDIKDPHDLATLKDLIQGHAHVFSHNLRPGSAAQYGLDAASLRANKPELVCCELGAFGHVGPLNKEPGYDPLMQAFGGIMTLTGEEGQPPVRAGVSVCDFGTGMWSVIGILAALYRCKGTNKGATVNSSLLETAIAWMSLGLASYAADGYPGSRHGSGVAFLVPHRAYPAADGHIAVSCGNDRLFAKLCEALGHAEWATDERFANNMARVANRDAIDGLIGDALAEHTRAHWKDVLGRAGIASAPVQTTAEIFAHEQTKALGILGHPADDTLELVGVPLSFDGQRPPPLSAAPSLGRDNEQLKSLLRKD
ncbi:CaiB/BaiF CoA transferase family protein [Ramlibacter sp.]|uniref:CaiB/BaiF CoA transferase family protein n=1 Tax=Ramlibacter sp. TaxID=1917967 RepID=UPI003D117222